jgi:hypothetical protein
MLPEEQAEISRHFYDLASARSGFGWENCIWCRRSISRVCKGPKLAQAAPCLATKCRAKLHRCAACNRGHQHSLRHGILTGPTLARSRNLLTKCAPTGGIPIGYKLSAQHIRKDMVPLWLRAWKRQLCWSRLHRAVDQYAIQSTYGATLGAKKTIFIQ